MKLKVFAILGLCIMLLVFLLVSLSGLFAFDANEVASLNEIQDGRYGESVNFYPIKYIYGIVPNKK